MKFILTEDTINRNLSAQFEQKFKRLVNKFIEQHNKLINIATDRMLYVDADTIGDYSAYGNIKQGYNLRAADSNAIHENHDQFGLDFLDLLDSVPVGTTLYTGLDRLQYIKKIEESTNSKWAVFSTLDNYKNQDMDYLIDTFSLMVRIFREWQIDWGNIPTQELTEFNTFKIYSTEQQKDMSDTNNKNSQISINNIYKITLDYLIKNQIIVNDYEDIDFVAEDISRKLFKVDIDSLTSHDSSKLWQAVMDYYDQYIKLN